MTLGTKTIKQLCQLYKIDRRTLRNWFESVGVNLPKGTRIVPPVHVQKLVKAYGEPE